jgi:hypothetical protein
MVPFLTVFSLLVRHAKFSASKRIVGENYTANPSIRQQIEAKTLIKTIANGDSRFPNFCVIVGESDYYWPAAAT